MSGMLSPRPAAGRRARTHAFLAAMGVVAFVSLACTLEEGERSAGEGTCPSGETCSEATPQGLSFFGTSPGDTSGSEESILRTAVGGEQEMIYLVHESGALGEVRVESGAPGVLSFTGHEQTDEVQGRLILVAHGDGRAMLRFLDSEGALYDRIEVRAASIAEVTAIVEERDSALTRDRLRPGELADIVVRLFDADGNRLVDTAMTITPHDLEGGAEGAATSWDGLRFTVPAGATSVSFTVHAGGQDHALVLPVEAG